MKTMKNKNALLAALATAAVVALADGDEWVYTPERHATVAPATAWGMMAGLDAVARGLCGTAEDNTVDKWFWSMCFSNECLLCFDPTGMGIILR